MDIIKKLSRSIREYKMVSIMTPVCIVFEVIFEILIPFMMAKMIDSGISSGNESALVKYGTLLILCVMAGLVFGILSGGLCATASAGFAKNLRKDMYYKIQEYSFANIDKFSSSSIVTRLTTDVTNVQNAYMMIIRIAVSFFQIFVYLFHHRIISITGHIGRITRKIPGQGWNFPGVSIGGKTSQDAGG